MGASSICMNVDFSSIIAAVAELCGVTPTVIFDPRLILGPRSIVATSPPGAGEEVTENRADLNSLCPPTLSSPLLF